MALLIGCRFYQSDASDGTTTHNGGCHSENVGERRGISLSNITTTVFASVFGFTEGRQGERGLSVLMKAYLPDTEYTTYTWG